MRMRKKKNLVPRMERCAAQLIRDPYEHRGHWRDLMPQARELRVELAAARPLHPRHRRGGAGCAVHRH